MSAGYRNRAPVTTQNWHRYHPTLNFKVLAIGFDVEH
jgi:hypothetical protein